MIPIDLNEDFKYYNSFLNQKESIKLYNYLVNNIDWEEREIIIFGKKYSQPRLIKWFGDKDYIYSKEIMKKERIPFEINLLKEKIEQKFNLKFNSVLLNYYRSGNDSMGKHSDDEKELGLFPVIASISIGIKRDFIIFEKIGLKRRYKLELENGSLLIMKNNSQKLYSHELPKRKNLDKGRINLTFRYIY